MIKTFTKGLAVTGALTLLLGSAGGVVSATSSGQDGGSGMYMHDSRSMMQSMPQVYKADLGALNGSGAHGTAYVVAQGDEAQVSIQTYGLSKNLPHAQHIHMGDSPGTCPTLSADANHDGLISTAEAADNYGPIKVSLTTSGDYSPASALAVERFPVGGSDNMTIYQRSFRLPAGITADNLGNGEIVQHGISTLFGDPMMYDGSKPSSIAPSLPLEATIPADCGRLVNVTPMMLHGLQNPAGVFDASLQQALVQLRHDTGDTLVAASFEESYNHATSMFQTRLMQSAQWYAAHYMTDPAQAKNVMIDQFNNAKADYFNQLEVARNQLVSELSGNNDVAKDMFVNHYNTARDLFGNQLEMLKNDFADCQW